MSTKGKRPTLRLVPRASVDTDSTAAITASTLSSELDPTGQVFSEGLEFNSLQLLLTEIDRVYDKAKSGDWDGEGAEAVAIATYQQALRVIAALPHGLPVPNISADVDGYIELEWYCAGRSLSMLIGSSTVVLYAGYQGEDDRFSGRFTFRGKFPADLRDRISEVFDAVSS